MFRVRDERQVGCKGMCIDGDALSKVDVVVIVHERREVQCNGERKGHPEGCCPVRRDDQDEQCRDSASVWLDYCSDSQWVLSKAMTLLMMMRQADAFSHQDAGCAERRSVIVEGGIGRVVPRAGRNGAWVRTSRMSSLMNLR